jgi:two-component system, OmpR family, phosphate regulon sensor histidine kinase PhoR
MKKRKLIRQIFPPYLAILFVSLAAVSWLSFNFYHQFYLEQTSTELESKARILAGQVLPLISPANAKAADELCKSVGKSSGTRITIILPNGKVIGDTNENPADMDSHSTREEIVQAKTMGKGKSVRYSKTIEKTMMYVAIPLTRNGETVAILRTSMPVASLDHAIQWVQFRLAFAAILIAMVLAGISWVAARSISLPILAIKNQAQRFARGDFSGKSGVYETEEMADLAESMNTMAVELNNRINTIIGQRNELETVLSSMFEGVIAVDKEEKIIKINASAAEILDIDPGKCRGQSIQGAIRNVAFQKFIVKASSGNAVSEEDIVVYNKGERILNLHGSPISDSQNKKIGTLVVIGDVTQLRRLENMRRDFVANVSHEIKTPLTAIKGFVETLYHDLDHDPEKSMRFLSIILKHVDRLNALVEDLLSLSRIEDQEQGKIRMDEGDIMDVIETAVHVCRTKAEEKKIAINVAAGKPAFIRMDKTLLEQAIVNILDNAINYSEAQSNIDIEVIEDDNKQIRIRITDYGIGIPREHLPRLFERFYRVDRARSRKMGGTGLGLSIVKHIVAAHGGTVEAESTPGKGSTFTLLLPVKKADGYSPDG